MSTLLAPTAAPVLPPPALFQALFSTRECQWHYKTLSRNTNDYKKSVSFFPHSSYENVIHLTPTARQQSLPRDLASLRAQHPPCYTWFPAGAVLCPQHPTVTMGAELGSWFPRLSASVPKVFSILDEVQSSNHCHIFSCTNSELHIEGSNSDDMDTN